MADYIPRPLGLFEAWEENMMTVAGANLTQFGIRPEEFAPLTALQTKWRTTYAATEGKKNRTSADILARDIAREDYETAIRVFKKRFLTENPKVSDVDLDRMGFTVPKKTNVLTPPPTTMPFIWIDFSVHLRHIIHFRDSQAGSLAKPYGVHGCEIWSKVGGTAPVNASELTFLALDTRSPYTLDFLGENAGQTVYYWCRWVNTRGEHGPWSEPVSAIIA
jgi:hypothetical protein